MIPPFALAAGPEKKITLREATVQDCIDFAGVDPGHEEEVTTLFLNRLQDKATFVDSKTWTAEDRRLGLFWYWMHTTKDFEIAISYDCRHCGDTHTWLCDYRQLAENYTQINGLPVREFEFNDQRYSVKPINGAQMEELENMRQMLNHLEESKGRKGEYFKQAALLKLARITKAVDVPSDKIMNMKETDYAEFTDKVLDCLEEMTHGLDSDYEDGAIFLNLPPHKCPKTDDQEATTRVRVSFRNIDYISAL